MQLSMEKVLHTATFALLLVFVPALVSGKFSARSPSLCIMQVDIQNAFHRTAPASRLRHFLYALQYTYRCAVKLACKSCYLIQVNPASMATLGSPTAAIRLKGTSRCAGMDCGVGCVTEAGTT